MHTSRYGNSRVFTARFNGKKVIVKTLKPECANDLTCRESLKQEYETTSFLDNKYIRKALDFVQIEGLGDCIIFEYVEGKSLAEHVRVGTLSEKQVKNILAEVCDALYYLQRNGIVHSSKMMQMKLYYDRQVNTPLISTSYPTVNSDFGMTLTLQLTR